jgi:ribosomal protein L5
MACKNVHRVPKLEKVVIHSAISADSDKARIEEVLKEIGLIAGQKPIVILSKRSISYFKLRAEVPNSIARDQMYEFVYRLVSVTLTRIRDFRGLWELYEVSVERKSVDMDITFVTNTSYDRGSATSYWTCWACRFRSGGP